MAAVRILGIDPGLRHTGWGVIEADGSRLAFVASGAVHSKTGEPSPTGCASCMTGSPPSSPPHRPDEAAVEETFVNRDPQSTLKLGHARGIALVVPALAGLEVHEYAANLVKKTVVGAGHAEKTQIAMMVKVLLPRAEALSPDAADALAVAICHAQHRGAENAKPRSARVNAAFGAR